MTRKMTLVLNQLLVNKYRQNYIANINGISGSYISRINKRLQQLKYNPKVKDSKVVCLVCESNENLCIHHDHNTGRPIAILCKGCNGKFGNKAEFDGKLSDNLYSINATTYRLEKSFQITIDDKIIERLQEKWKEIRPLEDDNPTHIIKRILIEYIENEKK